MNRGWSDAKAKDVATISGAIWNGDTRTVAHVVNRNAEILKDALNRIAELEEVIKSRAEKGE